MEGILELWRVILGNETPVSLIQNLLLFHIRRNSPFVSLLLSFFLPFLAPQISLLRSLFPSLVETATETPSLVIGCDAFAVLLSPPFLATFLLGDLFFLRILANQTEGVIAQPITVEEILSLGDLSIPAGEVCFDHLQRFNERQNSPLFLAPETFLRMMLAYSVFCANCATLIDVAIGVTQPQNDVMSFRHLLQPLTLPRFSCAMAQLPQSLRLQFQKLLFDERVSIGVFFGETPGRREMNTEKRRCFVIDVVTFLAQNSDLFLDARHFREFLEPLIPSLFVPKSTGIGELEVRLLLE